MAKQDPNFKHILLDHIQSHRERCRTLAQSMLPFIEEKNSTKKTPSNCSLKILVHGLEGVDAELPKGLQGNLRDADLGLSAASIIQSLNHSQKAASEFQQENFEASFRHLLQAEGLLGGAKALSQFRQVQSAFAQGKARMSHSETRSLRAQVIDHWRKRCDPKLSAQKAADDLLGIFRWKDGTDVAHRTLAMWIAQARKTSLPRK